MHKNIESLCCVTGTNIVLQVNYTSKTNRKCALQPRGSLLLQQCLEETDPGMPLAPASNHPPTLFPVAAFGISHSAVHNHWDQPLFFELNCLLLINYELPDLSELFHWDGGHINCPVNMHLWASYTYFSLGFYFDHDWCGSGGYGLLFSWDGRGEVPGCTVSLENVKPEWQPRPLPEHAEASQDKWGKIQDAKEATLLLEQNLSQALLDQHGLVSAHVDSHICDFLENHFLGEEMKLIKKDGWPPDPPPQAVWSPGWVGWISIYWKGSPSSTTRSLWGPVAFEVPP